jgi:alpha-mannosidase
MTLHMVGNAHLDPVWLWRWTEGCSEAIGTFWAAVDRLEETPGFVFTRGEAVLYDWVRRLEPRLFERIQHFVREGRWVPVGGWWVQPDCNLPNGESFLRQALYGKAHFARYVGVNEITVGYNVDSFGHAATLPMLLRHSGLTHYVFMRPMHHEKPLPTLFNWVAPDGSSVLAYRIADTYHTSFSPLETHLENHLELLRDASIPLMCFYGVGDHGGGPTRENVARILEGQARGEPLEFSHPARYFASVEGPDQPRVQDELQQHAIGCYSVIAPLKRANRRAEAGLADAETAIALLAHTTPNTDPTSDESETQERLGSLWRTLLFNQFHDTLGGTSTKRATRDALEQLTSVISEADVIAEEGVRRLTARLEPRTRPDDAAFVVVNLTGQDFDGLLEYEPWLGWDAVTPRRLVDDAGAEIEFQDLRPESRFMGIRRLAWRARIPAFGYRLYRFTALLETAQLETASLEQVPPEPANTTISAHELLLENARFRLEIDPLSGGIARLYDKTADLEVFPGGAHDARIVDDPTDTWGHGVDGFGNRGETFELEHAEVLETGPVRAVIRTRARAGSSRLETTYVLPADPGLPLELRVRVEWHERQRLLRLRFGSASDETCRVEVPYGSVTRDTDGRELPGQRWARISNTDHDVLIATDALSSLAASPGALHFTALRSPAFAHHEPGQTANDPETEYTDQGEHHFTIRVLSGTGLTNADAYTLAEHLARPPRIVPHTSRSGWLPHSGRFFELHAQSALVTWLKRAENGDGVIARVLETEGQPGAVQLAGSSSQPLRPHGIHSFRVTPEGMVTPTDGLES